MKTIAERKECDGCASGVVKHSREWSGHCSVPVRVIYCKLAECERIATVIK